MVAVSKVCIIVTATDVDLAKLIVPYRSELQNTTMPVLDIRRNRVMLTLTYIMDPRLKAPLCRLEIPGRALFLRSRVTRLIAVEVPWLFMILRSIPLVTVPPFPTIRQCGDLGSVKASVNTTMFGMVAATST